MTEELALPDPQKVTLAKVPALVEEAAALRAQMRADENEQIVELYDRLGAVRQYIRDHDANQALEAEERRTEVVIGELLGPADQEQGGRGNKAQSPNGVRGFGDPLIWAFRRMCAYEDLVERALTADSPITKRAAILRFIERELRPKVGGDWQLIHSPIADLQLEDVDVIVTDPPYPKEYLPQWRELRDFAARALRPGGSLFAMSGQSWLPEVFEQMAGEDSLSYQWTMAYMMPGGTALQFGRQAMNAWKPVLWFVKGKYDGQIIRDVFKSDIAEKESHHWGQSESGFADLVKRTTEPGELIVDPFVRGGTTGVVAVRLGRRFIGADVDQEKSGGNQKAAPMSATERYAERELIYQNWHRKHSTRRFLGEDAALMTMQDVDGLEYCCYCNEVVGIVQIARDVGQPTKKVTVDRQLADRIGVPGVLVFYKISETATVADGNGGQVADIERFRVQVFAPAVLPERELSPEQMARWLWRMHENCGCRDGS